MTTTPCVPCCAETQTVNVPGIEGDAGDAGTNGQNAYTVLTAASAVPGVAGGSVTFTVANSQWAVVGQMIVLTGPSTYRITALPTSTSITATWQAATGDVAAGTAIASGAGVSPAGVGVITTLSVYGAGTAYQLTATAAKVDLGTTDPSLTITAAGTYLLLAQFRIDYTGATFAASRSVTMKLRRTNNTAADITNASTSLGTAVVTTFTGTFDTGVIWIPVYVTANANDVIEMWGSVSVVPTAGSLDVVNASIVALKIV